MTLTPERLTWKLQFELTRKAFSFAEYIAASSPYIPKGAEHLWKVVQHQARIEQSNAQTIAELIVELGGVPTPGLFDEDHADTNYLSILYLCGLLIKLRKKTVSEMEDLIAEAKGHPHVQGVLQQLLEQEHQMLAELEEIQRS